MNKSISPVVAILVIAVVVIICGLWYYLGTRPQTFEQMQRRALQKAGVRIPAGGKVPMGSSMPGSLPGGKVLPPAPAAPK